MSDGATRTMVLRRGLTGDASVISAVGSRRVGHLKVFLLSLRAVECERTVPVPAETVAPG
jgi:hypothetical protein